MLKIKWLSEKLGFEKLVLKSNRIIGFFIKDKESNYYNSQSFIYILQFVQTNPKKCKMREKNNMLSIVFFNISDVDSCLTLLKNIIKESLNT